MKFMFSGRELTYMDSAVVHVHFTCTFLIMLTIAQALVRVPKVCVYLCVSIVNVVHVIVHVQVYF